MIGTLDSSPAGFNLAGNGFVFLSGVAIEKTGSTISFNPAAGFTTSSSAEDGLVGVDQDILMQIQITPTASTNLFYLKYRAKLNFTP